MTSNPISSGADPLEVVCRHASDLIGALPAPVRRLRLEAPGAAVELEWPEPVSGPVEHIVVPAGPESGGAAAPAPDTDLHYVHAFMVGTFYRSREPGANPFVREGDKVEAGQQMGIIEAMKMMIPLDVDRSGEVVKILPEDGTAVEYGQPIIAIMPEQAA